jgi:hypothetical protein
MAEDKENTEDDTPVVSTEEAKEEGVYSTEEREQLVEDDEVTPEEAGFMQGEEEEFGNCSNCNKAIEEKEQAVNKDIHDNTLWFCCKNCLKEFEA